VSSTGEPLFYRLGDTLAYPTPYTLLDLSARAFHPGATQPDLNRQARGPTLDSWTRRLVLAWSLQAGRLLGSLQPGSRLAWRRAPRERLEALMPFAQWGRPVPRVIDGELVWVADGFVTSETFPLVERIPWRRGAVSSARAGFLGVVRAESGETRLYLRPDAGVLAQAWADVAAGVVRPAVETPRPVSAVLAYPLELFEGQARVLERSAWNAGALSGRPESGTGEPLPPERGWVPGAGGTRLVALYERPLGRRISTVLAATMHDGMPSLRLVRVDTGATLPAPRILEETWNRFPSYQRLAESVRASVGRGDTLGRGPLVVWRGADALGAYRTRFASRPGGGVSLVWVSVAQGRRVGAGRTLEAAWDNLLGGSAPVPPVVPSATLDEARRWVQLADSALRAGDWATFGRAFDALRQVLAPPRDSVPRDSTMR
jgi:hypothetical protein